MASRAHKAPAHATTSRSIRVFVLRWSSPQLSGDLLKQATSDSAEDAQLLQVEEDTGRNTPVSHMRCPLGKELHIQLACSCGVGARHRPKAGVA